MVIKLLSQMSGVNDVLCRSVGPRIAGDLSPVVTSRLVVYATFGKSVEQYTESERREIVARR